MCLPFRFVQNAKILYILTLSSIISQPSKQTIIYYLSTPLQIRSSAVYVEPNRWKTAMETKLGLSVISQKVLSQHSCRGQTNKNISHSSRHRRWDLNQVLPEHNLENFLLHQPAFCILYYPSHNMVLYQQATCVTFISRLISAINAPR